MIIEFIAGGVISVLGAVVITAALVWALYLLGRLAGWLRIQYRRACFRAAVLLGRPVPGDGLPLDEDEAHGFIDAVRGWDLPAFEPARESWRQP